MTDNSVHVTVLPPNLKPAISPSVHLSLTIACTAIYSCLFFFVYVQLWMILYYKHRHFSYQTVFLFLCLLWAGLRTTLFSFYFQNCVLVNSLDTFSYWLLYCCPVCLQFITLCLLVLFFANIVCKTRMKYEVNRCRCVLITFVVLAVVLFLATNISCAVVQRQHQFSTDSMPVSVSMLRVGINDSLFIICGVILSICIFRMSKMPASEVVLEARGMTVRRAVITCAVIILVYTSRAVYNMVAISKPLQNMLSFGYGWVNVSDQADIGNLDQGSAYICFGIVLFMWEFLPTFTVVMFFRVHKPVNTMQMLPDIVSSGYNSRAYFFDNPRRYDSDDDLSVRSRGDSFIDDSITALAGNSISSVNYGSFNQGIAGTPPALRVTNADLTPSPLAITPTLHPILQPIMGS